jgi:hypothetical protein
MRTTLLSLSAALLLAGTASAQTMGDALYDAAPVTWVGLDFSEAKFVPSVEFADVDADARLAMLKWNNLLEQEPKKYDLGRTLGIKRITTNTSFMREVNEGITAEDLLGREPYSIPEAKIPEMVKSYKFTGEGVGVVFIVSTFDKTQEKGEFYVTFFNMKTKEVMHTERLMGKPMGIGLRNYWAGSISSVLKNIEKSYAATWRAKYK